MKRRHPAEGGNPVKNIKSEHLARFFFMSASRPKGRPPLGGRIVIKEKTTLRWFLLCLSKRSGDHPQGGTEILEDTPQRVEIRLKI
ncbi:MAG: hypothetical protein CVU42_13660 [Chloroflexi bacterium HGW-Chloroflexi-4]|nr:MAG: hypothetical protein CVU42_13660 [Chloroflexi bacterium HGW-Chloroflexi-4]